MPACDRFLDAAAAPSDRLAPPGARFSRDGQGEVVIGQSPRMRAIFDVLRVIADSQSNVVITGETGTGKELIASVLHQASGRRHKPFVAVSCAILSEALIETELFGHERGAFTGAIRDRPGRFELAHGGTIFLDDIDDVPLAMQVKLLRVLQTRTVERLGAIHAIPVDVRIVTATKTNLADMVAAGTFRDDLYYRLNVIPITLPPLRDRREDIPALVDTFLRRAYRQRGEEPRALSPAIMDAFMRYPWRGNVRELENACERMAQTCTCDAVQLGCMPGHVLLHELAADPPDGTPPAAHGLTAHNHGVTPISLDARLRDIESSLIAWALRTANGNKSRAAALLEIKRSTLGDRIAKLGLGPMERDLSPVTGAESREASQTLPAD